MSIQAMSAVLQRSQSTGNERLVLLAIANHLGDHDGREEGFASQETIAREARCSVRTVRTAIHSLVERGEIVVVTLGRKIGTEGRATVYRLALDSQPATSADWESTQPATGCRPAVGHPQDLASLGLGVDLEDLPSERSGSSCSSAATEPSRARARDTVGARCAERLCLHLAAKIEGNGCKRPTVTKQWLDAARLLVDVDLARYARPEGDPREDAVIRCIDWATEHDFWAANVLSMPTLRKQWDRLEMQKRRETRPTNGGVGMGRQYDAAIDSLREARERVLAGGTL